MTNRHAHVTNLTSREVEAVRTSLSNMPEMVARRTGIPLLNRLFLGFTGVYVATLVGVRAIGLQPVIPWTLLLALLLIAVPFAAVLEAVANISVQPLSPRLNWAILLCSSVVVLSIYHLWYVWLLGNLALLAWPVPRTGKRHWKPLIKCFAILVLGLASLWNANYLLARFTAGLLHDPTLRSFDFWFYSLMLGHQIDYLGLFPLIQAPFVLRVFDNSYTMLVPEILLVLVLECQSGDERRAVRFIKGLFRLYAFGIACFVLYPAIGPCLYFPASQDVARALPSSISLASGMLSDYRSAVSGGPLSGLGYFIAIPSLHVMVAIQLQYFLYEYPVLFRLFLPINAALILSTVLLGYHYVLDLIAASTVFVVAGVIFLIVNKLRRRPLKLVDRPQVAAGC